MSVPCHYPVRLFGIGMTCNNRIALIVVLSGSVLQVLERDKIPFFYFFGKDGEDRTRDLTVHNLTSCLQRHCQEVDQKCYVTNATRVIAF